MLKNSDHVQQNLPDWSHEVRNNLSVDIDQRTPSKPDVGGKEQTTAMTIMQQLDQATQKSRETRGATQERKRDNKRAQKQLGEGQGCKKLNRKPRKTKAQQKQPDMPPPS